VGRFGVGQSVRRVEDVRFLTGRGQYLEDVRLPGELCAHFVRSPHAHARIVSINTDQAKAEPGVVRIATGADFAAEKLGGMPNIAPMAGKGGSKQVTPPHPAIPVDMVRYVGEPVAVVIAETAAQARDAAELVEVEYESLPAVIALDDALAKGAPLVWPEAPNNVSLDWEIGDQAATDAAFAKAAHVTRIDLLNNRIVTFNPETIITPAGTVPREIYLLLAGKVEILTQDPGSTHFLFSGSLLAESAAINNQESEDTYRSVGFVQALRLPSDLYRNFVERFFSSAELLKVRKVEERLRRTFLFSDAVTNSTLFSLAKNCTITRLHAGKHFSGEDQHLHLIGNGRLARGEDEKAPVLGKGEFWGADSLFAAVSRGSAQEAATEAADILVALDSCEIYSVPLKLVSRIPVVRWKLFEAFRNAHPYAAPRYRGTAR